MFRPLDTERQRRFYDDLSEGGETRGVWGMDKRFSHESAVGSKSFAKYFTPLVEAVLDESMHVLDLGCGNGIYFPLVARRCASLTGAELSASYARLAMQGAAEFGLPNVRMAVQDSVCLGFPDDAFDAALCLDSLHHVFDLEGTLSELARVVKPGGDLVFFEPNCLNPALLVMCVLDRNEWGAVSRCYKGRYERVFGRYFDLVTSEYNGLLIGPQGRLATAAADFMLESALSPLVARFSPEIFFHLKNR